MVEVRHLGGHRLALRFEDGVAGELDLHATLRFEGVFAPLAEVAEFAKVRVNPELGTIVWPNGADLDPDTLYSAVTGQPIDLRLQRELAAAIAEADRGEGTDGWQLLEELDRG
ncbi:MAG TPA: DUF2442 domain-containing protein [Thermoanaerobaculia bacterium]|nr:DUF2442 domain-containing protein [Thermoanaerobaculia bacterium]